MAQNILRQGGTLHAGNFLRTNSNWHLVMQHDGNLVLYRSQDFSPHNAVWSSNTNGKGAGCRFTMQDDGNAVVYDAHNRPVWASNTDRRGHGPYEFVLDEGGYVSLFDGSGTRQWANREDVPRQRQQFAPPPFAPSPFGAPPQQPFGQPFGAPPPQVPYGQPPQQQPWGQPHSAPFGQPQQTPYGQPAPYGQQQSWQPQGAPFGQPHSYPQHGQANQLAGRKFGIKTHNGHYLQAVDGGNVGAGHAVNANPEYISTWETFEGVRVDDSHIAFKTLSGTYVSAHGGGGGELHTNGPRVDVWEKFLVEPLGGNRYAFKSGTGHYICAEQGGGHSVVCNRQQRGDWESFTIEFV